MFRCIFRQNNVCMAFISFMTPPGLFTPNDVQSMVSEITKMQEFHHPHVMPLIGVCLDAGSSVSIVMPYMTNGSLLDYLKKERGNLDLTVREDSDKVYCSSQNNYIVRSIFVARCACFAPKTACTAN